MKSHSEPAPESGVQLVAAKPHYRILASPGGRVLAEMPELFSTAPLISAAREHNTRAVAVRVSDDKRLGVTEKPRRDKSLSAAFREELGDQERATNEALGRGQYGEREPAAGLHDETDDEERGAA